MLFFFMARGFYSRFGFAIKRVLTDNGPCYRDHRFRTLLFQQRVRHRFTRPYTPRTTGKSERFIQTALREWAYARTYQTSIEREEQLDPWLHDYNFHRQHASLNHNTPASRAGLESEQPLEPPHLGIIPSQVQHFHVDAAEQIKFTRFVVLMSKLKEAK